MLQCVLCCVHTYHVAKIVEHGTLCGLILIVTVAEVLLSDLPVLVGYGTVVEPVETDVLAIIHGLALVQFNLSVIQNHF